MNNSSLIKMKTDFKTRNGLELKKNGIYSILNPTRDKLISADKAELFDPKGLLTSRELGKLTSKKA